MSVSYLLNLKKKMIIRHFKFIILFSIGILTFYWVYSTFSGKDSLIYINENRSLLVLLFFAHLPTLFFDSWSWKILITTKKLTLWWCVIITWISQTASKIMPTGVLTGEFVRIYLGKKKGVSTSQISATVIGDLLLATLSLMILGLMSVVIFFFYYDGFEQKFFDLRFVFFGVFCIFIGSIFFSLGIRYRLIKVFLKRTLFTKQFICPKSLINSLLKIDFVLYNLSYKLRILLLGLIIRLFGWFGGAIEILIFFWIIDIDISILDAVLIEVFTALMRSIVFFIPAGVGVQELSFVLVGNFIGLSNPISFSVALGRRIREIIIGIPAIITWWIIFEKKTKYQ